MNRTFLGLSLLLSLISGCDNVGGVFNSGSGSGGSGGTTVESLIEAPRERDLSLSGRPTVAITAPLGSGWHVTVPVVVIFSEALNRQSVFDETLDIDRLYVRLKVASGGQGVPAPSRISSTVNVIGSGRVVVLRPTALLPETSYEIYLEKGIRDLDGNLVSQTGVLGEFTTESMSTTKAPGVVAVYPPPNQTNIPRASRALVFLSVPATTSTVTTTSFHVRNEDATSTPALVGSVSYPLATVLGADDSRVLQFDSTDALPGDTNLGVVLTTAITAGGTAIDPGSSVPYSDFKTQAWNGASSVAVGASSMSAGFPNAVNRNNMATLRLDVGLPTGTLAGDTVEVRVYGNDPRTSATGDQRYTDEIALAAGGAQTLEIDLTGNMGTLVSPLLGDGDITMAARIKRGNVYGSWTVEGDGIQDLVLPTLTSLGPPTLAGSTTDFLTDVQYFSLFGKASEKLGKAELAAAGSTVELFAADTDGWFFLDPLNLNVAAAPGTTSYTFNFWDTAGNLNAAATSGTITQRGLLTGDLSGGGGDLEVVAWDHATMRPISGATVILETGVVTKPASSRSTAVTNSSGQVTFAGLGAGRYSVTIVATGYHLSSVVNTRAAHISLPLRPMTAGTASLLGSVVFTPASGRFAYFGCNAVAEQGLDAIVATASGAPNTIPSTVILPNRPIMLASTVGNYPTSSTSATGIFGCPMAIIAGLNTALSPPELGIAAEGSLAAMIPTIPVVHVAYSATYVRDMTGKGLDTSSLASGFPRVLNVATFNGLAGSVPFGAGFTSGTMNSLTVNGDYTANLASFVSLTPLLWSSLEARDTNGNEARCRRFFADYTLGTLSADLATFPAIPVLTLAASSSGTPSIQFIDTINPGALSGLFRVKVTDGSGRSWDLLVTDGDGTGTNTLQLPDVATSGATGLAISSDWTVVVEGWLAADAVENYCLEDFYRLHCTFARAVSGTITVN